MSKLLGKVDVIKAQVDDTCEAIDGLTTEFKQFGIAEKDVPMLKQVRQKVLRLNSMMNGLIEHVSKI
jgi:hypothetical protein